jgi:hypothetical protein
VKENVTLAAAVAGTETEKREGAAAMTVIELEEPVMEGEVVSVAVMVWPPTVFSVAGKVPAPFFSVVAD